MKEAVSRGKVEKSIWVDTKNMIADVLTKESVPTLLIMGILNNGVLSNDVSKSMPKMGVLNKDVSYGVKEVLDYSVINNDVSNSVPDEGVLNKDVFYGMKEVLDNSVLSNNVSNSVLSLRVYSIRMGSMACLTETLSATKQESGKKPGKIDIPVVRTPMY